MTDNPKTKARIDALDLTKGALVVLMVIYHSLNYTSEYYLAFRYMSFLPPSFIFITGYLISSVYFMRSDAEKGRVQQRLLVRGTKLLFLFTLLNIVAHLFLRRGRGGERLDLFTFFGHWQDVYLTGSGRSAVFEVLLPISYLLILSPLLIMAGALRRVLLPLFTLTLVILCTWLDSRGYTYANLNLLSAGALGMLAGNIKVEQMGALGRYTIATAAAYVLYVVLGPALSQMYLGQMLGAIIALALLFGLSWRIALPAPPRQQLIRLGQYSLVAYIVQIGYLQVLSRVTQRPAPLSPEAAFLFTATLLLTAASVAVIEWARVRSAGVDKFYRAIFA